MRRLIVIFASLMLCLGAAGQAVDSTRLATLKGMLDQYYVAMERESAETKAQECDFIIETCTDSLVLQEVVLHVYDHFLHSKVMGDEAVAIHVFDKWISNGKVKMRSDAELLTARLYAQYNRQSLIGCQAPRLSLPTADGGYGTLPTEGRVSVLFFYDTTCAKCRLETVLLRSFIMSDNPSFDLYAVYVGENEQAWRTFIAEQFNFSCPGVRIHHMWDPEDASDMREAYGLLQTPRLLLTDPQGEILGRGLDVEALKKLLGYAGILQDLYDRCPVGQKLPDLRLGGWLYRFSGKLYKTLSLRSFKGYPGYVVFYTEGCERCVDQMSKVRGVASTGAKVFAVNVDELWTKDEALATRVFDAFDLTTLPFTVKVDRKGRVTEKYVTFK